jgi:DNA-binding response OmpR family regulator
MVYTNRKCIYPVGFGLFVGGIMSARILVIEDDPLIQNLERLRLEGEQYEVLTTADPEEGLQIAARGGVDLVVLDLMLPKMDGFEVISRLREQDLSEEVPIIVVSGRDEHKDRIRGLSLGAVEFIGKPFQVQDLLSKVKEVLISSHV